MCADDVVCTGAEPLFFLDYIAAGRVVPEHVAALVEGVAEGCRRAGCALLGGETAEHPGVMPDDQFDLAGFCVGHRRRGLAARPAPRSRGRRARRARLERAALERLQPRADRDARGRHVSVGPDAPRSSGGRSPTNCSSPARSTRRSSSSWRGDGLVSAAAHITGGGLVENVPRAMPEGLGASIEPARGRCRRSSGLWPRPRARARTTCGRHSTSGSGWCWSFPPDEASEVVDLAGARGTDAHVIGRVTSRPGIEFD